MKNVTETKIAECYLVAEQDKVEVWVDGQFIGQRTPCFVQIPKGGEQRVELKKKGFAELRVRLSGKEDLSYFYFDLKPRPFTVINGGLEEQLSKTPESRQQNFLRLL